MHRHKYIKRVYPQCNDSTSIHGIDRAHSFTISSTRQWQPRLPRVSNTHQRYRQAQLPTDIDRWPAVKNRPACRVAPILLVTWRNKRHHGEPARGETNDITVSPRRGGGNRRKRGVGRQHAGSQKPLYTRPLQKARRLKKIPRRQKLDALRVRTSEIEKIHLPFEKIHLPSRAELKTHNWHHRGIKFRQQVLECVSKATCAMRLYLCEGLRKV